MPETHWFLTTPRLNPGLWAAYRAGALRSYHKHCIENALDGTLFDPASVACFHAAIRGGIVVGGILAKGPLTSPEQCHAMVEWAGQPGLDQVRQMLTDRIPAGVAEMKVAWISDDPECRDLTATMARTPYPTMERMGVRYVVATAGTHILNKWKTAGGVVADIPSVPYPDDRYATKMMWWDREKEGRIWADGR